MHTRTIYNMYVYLYIIVVCSSWKTIETDYERAIAFKELKAIVVYYEEYGILNYQNAIYQYSTTSFTVNILKISQTINLMCYIGSVTLQFCRTRMVQCSVLQYFNSSLIHC